MTQEMDLSTTERQCQSAWLALTALATLLLLALVLIAVPNTIPIVHADPIAPPAGYPKLKISMKEVTPTLAYTDGATLLYAIEILNTGAYTAAGTTLIDYLPEGTLYNGDAWASASPPPEFVSDTLIWEGEVGFDDSVLVTFTVAISPGVSGALVNTAVISHPLIARPVVISATTVVTDQPILAIDKSSQPQLPGPNKPLTYTVTVQNKGQAAEGLLITVTDRVPVSTTLLSVGDGGVASAAEDMITWTQPITLDTGAEATFQFAVVVGDVPSGTVIANRDYQVLSEQTGIAAGRPYSVTVVDPQLWIHKEPWPDPPGSNRELTYTLEILNLGSLATDLVITDRVPSGVTYLNGGTESSGVVSWTLPKLDTDESVQLAFSVFISDVMGFNLVNGEYGVCCAEGICARGSVLTQVVQGPNFQVDAIVVPIAHKPGGGADTEVFPSLRVHNAGPGNALDARVHLLFDRISVQSSDLYADPAAGTLPPFPDGPPCGDKCRSYVWQGDLGFGQTITFTTKEGQSTIGGDEGTQYTLAGVVTDSLSSMITEPVSDTAVGLITHYANLISTKGAPVLVGPGELLTYTITVYNSALSTDLPGVLTDAVPVNTDFVWASDGGLTRTVSDTVIVSWTLPLFSPGESVERSFTVRVHDGVISGTQIVNDRYGASGYGNVMPGADTSGPPVTTTVQEAGLIGSYKEVWPELTAVGSGNVLTYHLHVANTSPVDLAGVHVYDFLPWEASTYQRDVVASSGAISSDIISFQWTGDVAAFSSESLTFTVLVDWDYWGAITNTAVISHPRLAEQVVAQAHAYVLPERPVLLITKSATPDPVEIGAELTYDIEVTNMGARASQLLVADTVPWNAEYVEGSASGDGRWAGNQVQWTLPALLPLESRSFSFSVRPLGWYRVTNRLYSVRSAEGAISLGVPLSTRIAGAPDIYVAYLPLVVRYEP